jgi:small subunit ribosomal protein S17
MPEKVRVKRKIRIGRVVSDRMDKTIVVSIDRFILHPRYKKRVKRTIKMYAHDNSNQCRIGDLVKLTETRPLSRLKRWRVSDVIKRAK